MKKRAEKDLVVRNDLLKLLYATMLNDLPVPIVKEFWKNLPLELDGAALALDEQLRFIWDERKSTPFSYVATVLNALEPFLVSHNRSASEFVDIFLTGLNKGSIVNVSSVLKYIAPFLKFLFRTDDLRYFSMKNIMPFALERIVPTLYCAVVKHEKRGMNTSTIIALAMDRTFQSKTKPYDAGLFIARPIQVSPMRLGLPPFEEVHIMSDVRPLESVLDRAEWTVQGNKVVVRGKTIGSRVAFSEFCARHGIAFDGLAVPEAPEVVEIHSDYICPVRKRQVLYKGCVYGGPLYLIRLRYRSNVKQSDHCVTPIISETLAENSDAWKRVNDLHSRLLADLGRKIILVFRKSDGTMFANGKRLARSAPAQILRSIVKRYKKTGNTDFSNSDFTLEAWCGVPADNFSLRLQRVGQILGEKLPDIGIVRTARGRFELALKCTLEFREE